MKRVRTEGGTTAPSSAAQLSAHHLREIARARDILARVQGAAPDVPQLSEMLRLSAGLLAGSLQEGSSREKQRGAVHRIQVGSGTPADAVGCGGGGGRDGGRAPFDGMPTAVVELVLLHCDGRSLARISCASRFFGGGQQCSLVERVVASPMRLCAMRSPALRLHEVTSRTLQLWRLEAPVVMDVVLLRALAEVYARVEGRREEAARLYRRALEIEPNHVHTMAMFVALLIADPASWKCNKEAEALSRRVLELEPHNTLATTALAFLVRCCPEEAIALHRKALVLQPEDANAMHNLAFMLEKQPGGFTEAEELYRRALMQDPCHIKSLNRLGHLLSMDPERLDEAEQLLRRSLAADPDNTLTGPYLGVVLSARGSAGALAEALQLCERPVASITLGIIRAHKAAALGIVLLRHGDTAAARKKLDEAREHCGTGYPTTLMNDLRRMLE